MKNIFQKKIFHFSPIIVPFLNLITWGSVLSRYIFLDGEYAQTGRTFAFLYVVISILHIVFSFLIFIFIKSNQKKSPNRYFKNVRTALMINVINTFIVLLLVVFYKFQLLLFSCFIGTLTSIFCYRYLLNLLNSIKNDFGTTS